MKQGPFDPRDPHANQAVLAAGAALEEAVGVIVMVHGRGAGAEDIIGLFGELDAPGFAALAPAAAGHTWYPHSFLAPMESNQPYLNSAIARLESLVQMLVSRGFGSERIALLGFSQGACLVSEFSARHPRRYGAVIGLTGGLIGPPGTARDYAGSLEGTPVFLGCGDPDPHVPFERVLETEWVLKKMSAVVDVRRYPGMPHTINEDELDAARKMLAEITESPRQGRQ